LTPPGGFLYFPKMNNLLNISLFTYCTNNEIFDFILKSDIMRYAVKVKMNTVFIIDFLFNLH
jgi:hypothetical protein